MAASAVVALLSLGAVVYTYERYHRGPADNVFFGRWVIEGCMDCTNLITFEPDHNVIVFGDYMGLEDQLDYRGRWHAGGELLVIRYSSDEGARPIVLRILDITPEVIRVRWDGFETRLTRSKRTPPQASSQAMERPPKAFGVAHLVSR